MRLAYLLARLRTYVDRDRTGVVDRPPEVEVPTRLAKQLLRLSQSVALVRGKEFITDDEFIIMKKVALDSAPSARLAVFRYLFACKGGRVAALAKGCRISESSCKRHLHDLVLLGLATEETKARTAFFSLNQEARNDWLAVGGHQK